MNLARYYAADTDPPEYIQVSQFLRIKLKRYKPRPVQCQNCWPYGHTKKNCRNTVMCQKCAKGGHHIEQCNEDEYHTKCANCSQRHKAGDKDCIQFRINQDIIDLANQHMPALNFHEAQKLWNESKIEKTNQTRQENDTTKITRKMSTAEYINTRSETSTAGRQAARKKVREKEI